MAKQRSPNYPSSTLSEAVQHVKLLYAKERKTPVSVEIVAKALGYNSPSGKLSGNALTKIASLRQYGLVEKSGVGRLKVSDLGLDFVLHSPEDAEYQKAAKTAALNPPLFKQLYDELGEASDDAINAHLIKTLDFSPEGSARVIKAFRDTLAFAKLVPGGYNEVDEGEEFEESDDDVREEHSEKRRRPKPPGAAVTYSFPLGNGNNVELFFSADPNRDQIDVLLAQLNIVRKIAPATEPPEEEDALP